VLLAINKTANYTNLSRFSDKYAFEKPNDRRALELMNGAAKALMAELPDIIIAYGVSDEYRYS
jgi:tRNA(His) guanylyltransferase